MAADYRRSGTVRCDEIVTTRASKFRLDTCGEKKKKSQQTSITPDIFIVTESNYVIFDAATTYISKFQSGALVFWQDSIENCSIVKILVLDDLTTAFPDSSTVFSLTKTLRAVRDAVQFSICIPGVATQILNSHIHVRFVFPFRRYRA